MPTPDPPPTDAEIERRTTHREAFGDVIRKARERSGLSQEALAERAEISRPTIARIETGTTGLTLDRLWALAAALNVAASDLIAETERRAATGK